MILTEKFESSSSSKIYEAQFDSDSGRGTCNCPGWTKRSIRECKHTKALAKKAASSGAKLPEVKPDPVTPFDDLQESGGFAAPTIKPMLASAMKERMTLADFTNDDYVMEEKFDGHRLSVIVKDGKVTAWSRQGTLRPLCAGLVADLLHLPDGQYDGELCYPGGTSSDVVRLDLLDQLVYVVFDTVELMGKIITDLPGTERRAALELAVAHLPKDARVRIATQGPVSKETIAGIWALGGEGAIIKKLDATYKSGWRTPNWIKVKEIGAAELTITGFDKGKSGPCSVFLLRHDDGREARTKVLTDELIRKVHADPDSYIGRRVTISFMGETKSGAWRHPIFDHFTEEA